MSTYADRRPATFYVVPITPAEPIGQPVTPPKTESVLFFEHYRDHNHNWQWRRIAASDLNARRQLCDAGKIRLEQPALKDMQTILRSAGVNMEIDPCAEMSAAVARTLGEHHDHRITYHVVEHGHHGKVHMDIPVIADEDRALILVFTRFAVREPGGKLRDVIGLVATQDPEIKNSTSGCDDLPECMP